VPSLKVTVPVGTSAPAAGVTCAVKVMLAPLTTLVADAESVVLVATGVAIVNAPAADALAANVVSPLYSAVIAYTPAGRVELVRTAFPVASSGTAESVAAPFMKVIVPDGMAVPLEGVTFAAMVTD